MMTYQEVIGVLLDTVEEEKYAHSIQLGNEMGLLPEEFLHDPEEAVHTASLISRFQMAHNQDREGLTWG